MPRECTLVAPHVPINLHAPVGVMHPDGLFAVKHLGLVTHHTGLVQRGLSVQNEDIAVAQMAIHFLVDSRCPREQARVTRRTMVALLRREELVRDGGPLFNAQLVLYHTNVISVRCQKTAKHKVRTRNCRCPSSYSTIVAPGYPCGPVITSCRKWWKFAGVTGSGKVSLRAKTGGMPISLGSMFTSGEMTERAA